MSNLFQQLFFRKDPVFRAVEEAIYCLEEKNYDEALDILHNKALKRAPGDRRALLHIGIAHMLKGELDTAEGYLRPLATDAGRLDSEKAAAELALERLAVLRKEQDNAGA